MEKAQIQVVEDNRIIALGIQSTLSSLGYDVSSVVSSGKEAVKKAEEDNPDLVFPKIWISETQNH